MDPDYEERRPLNNAGLITRTLNGFEGSLDVLDFGGGNGRFAAELSRAGFRSAHTYDRFSPRHRTPPSGRFNLVTCFETLEHMPDPKGGAAEIAAFLADDGLLILSTLVQPREILQLRLHWWYRRPQRPRDALHLQGARPAVRRPRRAGLSDQRRRHASDLP